MFLTFLFLTTALGTTPWNPKKIFFLHVATKHLLTYTSGTVPMITLTDLPKIDAETAERSSGNTTVAGARSTTTSGSTRSQKPPVSSRRSPSQTISAADPMADSGTTSVVAVRLSRRCLLSNRDADAVETITITLNHEL